VRGLGVVCVTYGVGALKVINTTSQGFAEKSPVVIVSGAPGISERQNDPLLHHKVRDFGMQKRIFDEITCDSAAIEDARDANEKINRVLRSVLRFKQPGYLELPRDIAAAQIEDCGESDLFQTQNEISDLSTIREAATEAISMIRLAKK